ncbi:uncharacterized protein LOC142814690 [Rhipicephalus microplus]|uniref:uncharacterized protein LOC142765440 n=1 Tax=Rhipicephalus microplus TaxID=6941 RepID=UPI003F6BE685
MAQSRTTDPDIPASTTLRSGRVLSNSPPITDGVQASTAAPHHDCSEAISRGFSLFAQELKTSGFGCASFGSFNENEIPYFQGFKDDPTNWVSVINSVALKYSWSDTIKKSVAEGRLRGSAQAWHRFQGSTYATWQTWSAALISAFAPLPSAYDDRFMTMRSRRQGATEDVATYIYDKLDLLQACDIQWTSSAARQYIIDGIHDSTHAAVLSAYNHPVHISTFVRQAMELQDTSHRRAAAVGPKESASPRRGCYTCGRIGHGYKSCPQSQPQAMQYQSRPLPTLKVRVDGIGELTALVDTGAQRTALLRRHASEPLQPWTEPPLRGLGGDVLPVGALNLQLNTEAGSKFLSSVPVFDDLPTDMVLGADYLLSGEVRLTVEGSTVNLHPVAPSVPPAQSQGVDQLQRGRV